jgi:hypothetical protein
MQEIMIARVLKLREDTDIIRQNMIYYHNIGVDHTYIMLHLPSKELLDILDSIKVPATLLWWDKEGKNFNPNSGEYHKILTDKALSDGYKWIIGADADEFLILRKHDTIQKLIDEWDCFDSISLLFKWTNYFIMEKENNTFEKMLYRSEYLPWTKSVGKFNKEMYFVQGLHYIADRPFGQKEDLIEVSIPEDTAYYAHFPWRNKKQFLHKSITQGIKFNTSLYKEYLKDNSYIDKYWDSFFECQTVHLRDEFNEILKGRVYDPINYELCKIKE